MTGHDPDGAPTGSRSASAAGREGASSAAAGRRPRRRPPIDSGGIPPTPPQNHVTAPESIGSSSLRNSLPSNPLRRAPSEEVVLEPIVHNSGGPRRSARGRPSRARPGQSSVAAVQLFLDGALGRNVISSPIQVCSSRTQLGSNPETRVLSQSPQSPWTVMTVTARSSGSVGGNPLTDYGMAVLPQHMLSTLGRTGYAA